MSEPVTPPTSPKPGPADRVVTAMLVLTVLALLAQGVLTLYWQAKSLTEKRPRKPSPKPSVLASKPVNRDKPHGVKLGGIFHKPSTKPVAPRKGSDPAAEAPVYEATPTKLYDMYRDNLRAQGVTDEDYITLLALSHADRSWNPIVANAETMFEKGQLDSARQAVQDALGTLDKRHLFGRLRLLDMLSKIEFQSGNPETGRTVQRQYDDTRIEAAEIVTRGMLEQKDSGLTPETADLFKQSLVEAKDQRDQVSSFTQLFADQGQDPAKSNQRIMEFLGKAATATDKQGGR